MSELGERVARAYGWRLLYPNEHLCWSSGGYRKPTPDPENSWADFGALLEWASGREASPVPVALENASTYYRWSDEWNLADFRRAVTEAILEVVENE